MMENAEAVAAEVGMIVNLAHMEWLDSMNDLASQRLEFSIDEAATVCFGFGVLVEVSLTVSGNCEKGVGPT
jgi:hypothetical protein